MSAIKSSRDSSI